MVPPYRPSEPERYTILDFSHFPAFLPFSHAVVNSGLEKKEK
jgi:hypothetical protein